ncbi:MAG TPA: MvaI/BcnI family restriction endonuclease [Clostridia bacterium]|nr:MvaI/BcnI family restriction endonuclease [Clostridia bacterium]
MPALVSSHEQLELGSNPLRFVDLFCGIGGLRLALGRAGCQCIFCCDSDQAAQRTYSANFGEVPAGDIRSIACADIPRHDILCAGLPFESFTSLAILSERKRPASLFFEVANIIDYHRPSAFILEAVKGVRNYDHGRPFQIILSTLTQALGYGVLYKTIDVQSVVPQHRERIFLVGFREKRHFEFPAFPAEGPTLSSILEPDPDPKYTLADHVWADLQRHATQGTGSGFSYILAGYNDVARRFSALYYKRPSDLLIFQGADKNPRRLTPRECCRLMGFPDDFIIPVSDTQAYKQFGNSSVVPVVERISKQVVATLRRPVDCVPDLILAGNIPQPRTLAAPDRPRLIQRLTSQDNASRPMGLWDYAVSIVAPFGKSLASGDIFAKVLSANDDSGRHGVLIPTDAYTFFPFFAIPDPAQNHTLEFPAVNVLERSRVRLAYKYYERYPERRITRLHPRLNDRSGQRLVVFLKATHSDGTTAHYFDCATTTGEARFAELFELIFGQELQPLAGNFVIRPLKSEAFAADEALNELLVRFDQIRDRGWIDTMRVGDTGIGYTFETLVGVAENNDQTADFRGIEIKCKGLREGERLGTGKINLFQAAPTWTTAMPAIDRLKMLCSPDENGLHHCYSQITTTPNNLGMLLQVMRDNSRIDLHKQPAQLGHWEFDRLQRRLEEKHSRAAFIKAKARRTGAETQFKYEELVYCARPSIDRFLDLVAHRNIVFEFLMTERPPGSVRNHGYPWRLVRAELLDQLFTFQVKLR